MKNHSLLLLRFLTLLCGIALSLALPPLDLWFLAPLAFSGLLFLLKSPRIAGGRSWFATGLIFGFGYFVAALHWIAFAFFVDAKHDLWMMPLAVGGLALFLACYWGLAMFAAWHAQRLNVPLMVSLPVLLSLAEWLRGHLFTGFPWAAPGMMTDAMGGVAQLLSVMGVYGVSFCVVLWSVLPWAFWRAWHDERRSIWRLAAVALSLPIAWLWGEWRLAQSPTTFADNVSVRLVQPNISQSDKWREDNKLKIYDQLLALSASNASQSPNVIVWPESSVAFLLDESPVGLARIGDMLGPDRMLVAGAIRREKSGSVMDRYFTSVLAINGQGEVTGHYDKWRLVPGGEFLPLAWLLEPLGFTRIANLPESFHAGAGPHSLDLGKAGLAGPLVCYEVIFPENITDSQQRPHWLVNVTNDGWFGNSVGPYQHLAQARMRAIEQGLPLVRAANTGVSAVIDPNGRIVAATRLGEEAVLDSRLPNARDETIFARFGNWSWLSAMLVVMLLLGQKPKKFFKV